MPPKSNSNNKNKSQPAKENNANRKNAKSKAAVDEDADMRLLEEAEKRAEQERNKLNAKKTEEDQKKAQQEKEEETKQKKRNVEKDVMMAKLPPVYMEEIALQAFKLGEKKKPSMRDMCWLAYVIHNFATFVLETKRKLLLSRNVNEAIKSFEVQDIGPEEGSPHSWNVFHMESGAVYAIDVTLPQFETEGGRHGFSRDSIPEPGYIPQMVSSRLVPTNGNTKQPHTGFTAVDAGILPANGKLVVANGVSTGTTQKYVNFVKSSCAGRFKNMSPAEEKTGRILFKMNKEAPLFLEMHETLVDIFYNFSGGDAAVEKQ